MSKLITVILFLSTVTLNAHAKSAECSDSKLEIGKCNLISITIPGSDSDVYSPYAIESVLCANPSSPNTFDYHYSVTGEVLSEKFSRSVTNSDIFQNENFKLTLNKVDGRATVETVPDKIYTMNFACIFWE